MNDELISYYKYIISNMVMQCDYIDKYGINKSDKNILDILDEIAKSINEVYNEMQEMGIDVDNLANESYDIESNIRDFKIKRIFNDGRN